MNISDCFIEGLKVIEPAVFPDSRGYFFEAYSSAKLAVQGINFDFVQDNQSRSSYGVIRGLHFQIPPYAQTKLVRVLEGSIIDVAVDIRSGSSTYGQHFAIELSAENRKQLLIPAGFAHGFSVLTEFATLLYKCDQFYSKESERGILYNDVNLNIDWKVPVDTAIVSEKDQHLPAFATIEKYF